MADVFKILYEHLGITAAIVVVIIVVAYLFWKDGQRCHKERLAQAEKHAADQHRYTNIIIETLSDNSAANAQLASAITELGRRLN